MRRRLGGTLRHQRQVTRSVRVAREDQSVPGACPPWHAPCVAVQCIACASTLDANRILRRGRRQRQHARHRTARGLRPERSADHRLRERQWQRVIAGPTQQRESRSRCQTHTALRLRHQREREPRLLHRVPDRRRPLPAIGRGQPLDGHEPREQAIGLVEHDAGQVFRVAKSLHRFCPREPASATEHSNPRRGQAGCNPASCSSLRCEAYLRFIQWVHAVPWRPLRPWR